jgi:DNA polymerase III delta subunit
MLEIRVREGSGAAFLAEQRALAFFEEAGVVRADILRIHTPARGQESDWDGSLRSELAPLIPALQSVSLFGDLTAVLLLEANQLQVGEAATIASLLPTVDAEVTRLVVVSEGAPPAALTKALAACGATRLDIKSVRESDAAQWLAEEVKRRPLRMTAGARGALLESFGTDLAAMAGALDQLESSGGDLDEDSVRSRFRNRPDEPMWLYADALQAGDIGQALRRLSDFLVHDHPLQLLGYLEGDLRRRALSKSAPTEAIYAEWSGMKAGDWRVRRDWSRGKSMNTANLRRATEALARADRALKSAPEETHRVTMERLTVALAIWYSGRN